MLSREPTVCATPLCTRWAKARKHCAQHDPRPAKVPAPRKPIARTPMARGTTTMARSRPKPKPRPPGITEDTRGVVLARCGFTCEACGGPLGDTVDMHHRQVRALGNHGPENVVALHPSCHTIAPDAVHQRPEWARERGLIVSRHDDPATAPLTLPDGRLVLLTADGTYAPAAAAA